MNFCVTFRTHVWVVLLAFCVGGSQARANDLPLYFPTEKPEAISKQAFASPYFAALLEEFAKQVEKFGDASCLRAKRLDSKALQEHGRRILIRYGEKMIQLVQANIDERRFRDAGGARTLDEIKRLEKNPAVTELAKLMRDGDIDATAEWIVISFNRYLIVSGYDWRGFTGIETGNPALLKFSDEPGDRINKLLSENSPVLQPYWDLKDRLRRETRDALNASVAERPSHIFFQGAEKDVAELCLVKK